MAQKRGLVMAYAYLERYGLQEAPFSPTASGRFAYASKQHVDAVNRLKSVVTGKTALGVAIGPVGAGKTTLARVLNIDLLENGIASVYLPTVPESARRSDAAIIRTISNGFELKRPAANSTDAYYNALAKFAEDNNEAGYTTVVMIDEAHLLRGPGIRSVLQLLAIQTSEEQLVQIILFGQPELYDTIKNNRALNSRLARKVDLQPFSEEDVGKMIEHRLFIAGRSERLFTDSAIHELAMRCAGIPRDICRTAHVACENAFGRGVDMVDGIDVELAATELMRTGGMQEVEEAAS
jgi:general secretion pathway protein A